MIFTNVLRITEVCDCFAHFILCLFIGSSVIANEGGHGIVVPRKHFKHFINDLIFQKIQAVCRLLGYFGKYTFKPVLRDHPFR